jgi:hypothetical protein
MLRSLVTSSLMALFAATALHAAAAEWPSPVKWKPDERALNSGLYIQPRAPAKREKVEFSVIEPSGVARKNHPVRGSLPLYRGELADVKKVRLLNSAGKEIPVQALATGFWPEKTARFLCIDFMTDLTANQEAKFTLEYGSEVKPATASSLKIAIGEAGKSADITNGLMGFSFKAGFEFLHITLPKQTKALKPVTGQAVICSDEKAGNPNKLPLQIDEVVVTEQGPVQATVHLTGHYGSDKSGPPPQRQIETWRYPVSLYLRIYAGSGQVYVEHSFGYNADEYKDFVQSYGLTIPTGLAKGKFSYGPDDATAAESPLGVRLNQFAHNEWTLSGKADATGKRFGGWGAIRDGANQVLIGMREAWQNWPVAIRAEENGDLTYEILGEKPGRVLDLRYEDRSKSPTTIIKSHSMYIGEALSWEYFNEDGNGSPGSSARGLMKIHELFFDFAPAAPATELTRAFQKSLVPWPGQKRFGDTKSFGHIAVYGDAQYDAAREYFSVLLEGYPLVHEANGLYGWVDWGDMPMISGMDGAKFTPWMAGGLGWSNGERALQSYFFHYAAGGGRRFLDLGRTFVHHTIGIDTEHAGGDAWAGGYYRHNQVHWRHWPNTRQGGYRGWHAFYWLTGDPEVGRLCIVEGADSPANSLTLDLAATRAEPSVGSDPQHAANYTVATCCWITTGDWRFARAHHAMAKLPALCIAQDKDFIGGWNFYRVDKDGEPADYQLCESGTGTLATGYFFTYGGDDQLVDWAALTGDPAAVDAIIGLLNRHNASAFQGYHSPEGLYVGAALLTHDPRVRGFLQHRYPMLGPIEKFRIENRKSPVTYKSANEWADLGGNILFFKNGLSIQGAQAYEFLYWAFANELLAKDPTPEIRMTATARVPVGKTVAPIDVDASASKKSGAEIVKYEWSLNGKAAGNGPKQTLQVPAGPNLVSVKVTDANGLFSSATTALTVWKSDVLYQLCFFGGPNEFIEGHQPYDDKVGYGWAEGGIQLDTGAGYADRDKARGCACFFTNQPKNVYSLKVEPGVYHLEAGGAALMMCSMMPVTLQGEVIAPGINKNTRGIEWHYNGDVKVGADGLIKIGIDWLLDDKGQRTKDILGNYPTGIMNYIVVKKK